MQVIMGRPRWLVNPTPLEAVGVKLWQAKVRPVEAKTDSRRGAWLHEPGTRIDWWQPSSVVAASELDGTVI